MAKLPSRGSNPGQEVEWFPKMISVDFGQPLQPYVFKSIKQHFGEHKFVNFSFKFVD